MRKINILIINVLLLALAGCGGFVRDELVQMQQEIDGLRDHIESLNGSVTSVHEIVTEMAQGGYVQTIAEFSADGKSGYDLTFNNGKVVRLYNGVTGKDGKDADTPRIGMRQDPDGVWYWTLDGEWLEAGDGGKILAADRDGIVPSFKIADGKIFISVDKGNTWTEAGVDKSAEGISIVSDADVTSFKDRIVLTLADGSRLEVPRYQPVLVKLSLSGEDNPISAGETVPVRYTLEGNISGNTLVTAGTDGKYKTRIERLSESEGIVHVTCPNIYSDGYIYVMVNDGEGHSSVKVITFHKRMMNFESALSFEVDCYGGTISIPYSCNFDYDLVPAGEAGDWIHVLATRAEMISGTISLEVDSNPLDEVRTGVLEIRPKDNPDYVYDRIIITEASAYFTMDNTHITVPSSGGNYLSRITSSRGVSIEVPEDASEWLRCDLKQTGDYSYTLTISVGKNRTDDRKNASIKVNTGDGEHLQGTVSIVQLPEQIDHQRDLVMTVRANDIFDWTVYLPLRGQMDCYVDWGDGNVELFEGVYYDPGSISHKYAVQEPATFTVSVSGTVSRINSEEMPNKGAILTVEQWGDLDISEFQHGFEECSQLSSIPDDELGFFADVTDFSTAFRRCLSLKNIPEGLFSHARNAGYFTYTFSETPVERVPEGLFKACAKATEFGDAFSLCKSLTSVPENLFANCLEAHSIRGTFKGCSSLRGIPEKLFDKNVKATSFEYTFYECSALTAIPARLFSSNTETTSLNYCFYGCASITRIPSSLFDNNRKIERISGCFGSCGSVSGETPHTVIDGVKVHLYERFDYPDYFVTPIETRWCFSSGQYNDIENIPAEWKE